MTTTSARRGRVLHVLAAYDAKEAQGRCIRTIADRLPAEHHLVCGTLLDDGARLATVTETGASLTSFGRTDRARLAEVVTELRPDVVHFHGGPLGLAQMATGWSGDVPTVATVYAWTRVGRRTFTGGVGAAELVRTPVLAPRTMLNTVAPRAAIAAAARRAGVGAIITPDPQVRDALARHALPVGLFEGISPPQPIRRRPVPGHLVFAGRGERTRGPDLLAAAVGRLRARGRDVTARFCLLGTPDDGLVAELEATDGCTVELGGVDLAAAMARATAVVLPFRYDDATLAPTMVATEAMAAGVPVIGGDVRCLRASVIDRETGILVPPDDVEALATAIERVCTDPGLADRLGGAAETVTIERWRRSSVVDLARWAYQFATAGTTDLRRPPTRPAAGPTATTASPTTASPTTASPTGTARPDRAELEPAR